VVVDPEHADTSAIVDRGELVVLSLGAADRRHELHVDLDSMTRLRLLVALPALLVALVALRCRQKLMSRRLRIRQIPDGLTLIS